MLLATDGRRSMPTRHAGCTPDTVAGGPGAIYTSRSSKHYKRTCVPAELARALLRRAVDLLWAIVGFMLSLAGGSGSGYITGFCDKYWRPGMSAEQAEDFVRRAVGHALARDGSSGGCIRTVTISKAGVKRTFTPNDQVSALCGAALVSSSGKLPVGATRCC